MKVDLNRALEVARELESQLAGLSHVALTGSVLYRGESEKDIDLVVYPHDPKHPMENGELKKRLLAAGIVFGFETDATHVNRRVWVCNIAGLRVDIFVF